MPETCEITLKWKPGQKEMKFADLKVTNIDMSNDAEVNTLVEEIRLYQKQVTKKPIEKNV